MSKLMFLRSFHTFSDVLFCATCCYIQDKFFLLVLSDMNKPFLFLSKGEFLFLLWNSRHHVASNVTHASRKDLQCKCLENNQCLQLWKHSRNFLSMFWKFTWNGTAVVRFNYSNLCLLKKKKWCKIKFVKLFSRILSQIVHAILVPLLLPHQQVKTFG